MWTPWELWAGWSRAAQDTALENARAAAVECSRALVERMEVELYVAELTAAREGRRTGSTDLRQRERPSIIA